MTTPSKDQIARFTLASEQIRGEVITLEDTFADASNHQNLPPVAQQLLGEFLAASLLLAEVLKFEGTLTLQVRGDGVIPLIMAETTSNKTVRGVVKLAEGTQPEVLEGQNFQSLMGTGVLTLTIDPTKGQRYQGIVPLDGQNLAECLSHYFNQSEQLPTQVWLWADATHAAGIMLQALPEQPNVQTTPDLWSTAAHFASTAKLEEFTTLEHSALLYRLFHELEVTLFPADAVKFVCGCTRKRSANALTALGQEDALALLQEQKVIAIDCHFCGALYQFNKRDVDELFDGAGKPLH